MQTTIDSEDRVFIAPENFLLTKTGKPSNYGNISFKTWSMIIHQVKHVVKQSIIKRVDKSIIINFYHVAPMVEGYTLSIRRSMIPFFLSDSFLSEEVTKIFAPFTTCVLTIDSKKSLTQ